ncbi:MAG: hypothetical protein V4539_06435 [Bacteroidota bacterium]
MKKILIILAVLVMDVRDEDRANECPAGIKVNKQNTKKEMRIAANFLLNKMQS